MAEVSEGTYSQLRPVDATDGEGDARSVCRTASVTSKEPNVELTDGVRGTGTAAARFPSPPLLPEAAGRFCASRAAFLDLFALRIAALDIVDVTDPVSSSSPLAASLPSGTRASSGAALGIVFGAGGRGCGTIGGAFDTGGALVTGGAFVAGGAFTGAEVDDCPCPSVRDLTVWLHICL